MPRTCDIMCATDHTVRNPRPSPSVFAYCSNQSKTGGREGLGMLYFTPSLDEHALLSCIHVPPPSSQNSEKH